MTAVRRPILTVAVALCAGVLTACSSGGGTADSPSNTASTPSASSTAATKVIEVSVAGGVVSPPPGRVAVPLGTQVTVKVTSDVADEVHVHGYDIEQAVAAGATTAITFTADQAGVFEVETHESNKQLLQLQVS